MMRERCIFAVRYENGTERAKGDDELPVRVVESSTIEVTCEGVV